MLTENNFGNRHPVTRSHDNERTLPRALSRAIWFRDDATCRICHDTQPANGWEIDHIVPWSAGGPDTSTNLRLTCRDCNQARSNRIDRFARPAQPIIDHCQPDYGDDPTRVTQVRVWCALDRAWESAPEPYAQHHELAAVLARQPMEQETA
jgi:hypothetical protein